MHACGVISCLDCLTPCCTWACGRVISCLDQVCLPASYSYLLLYLNRDEDEGEIIKVKFMRLKYSSIIYLLCMYHYYSCCFCWAISRRHSMKKRLLTRLSSLLVSCEGDKTLLESGEWTPNLGRHSPCLCSILSGLRNVGASCWSMSPNSLVTVGIGDIWWSRRRLSIMSSWTAGEGLWTHLASAAWLRNLCSSWGCPWLRENARSRDDLDLHRNN